MQSLSPRSVIGFLTMCAPIVLIAAVCSISCVMSSISGVSVTETINGVDRLSCTATYYVQILNGVCSRGLVPGIDVETSCHTWDDTNYWKSLDEQNALLVDAGESNFVKTNFESEATDVWMSVKVICIAMLPVAFINFMACIMTSDVDKTEYKRLFPSLSHLDTDYLALVTSFVCNAILACLCATVVGRAQQSDVLIGAAWRTLKCRFVVAPSFSYYLIVLGGILSLFSAIVSSLCLLLVYCLKLDTSDKDADSLPSGIQQLEDYQNLKHQGVDVTLKKSTASDDESEEEEDESEDDDVEQRGGNKGGGNSSAAVGGGGRRSNDKGGNSNSNSNINNGYKRASEVSDSIY